MISIRQDIRQRKLDKASKKITSLLESYQYTNKVNSQEAEIYYNLLLLKSKILIGKNRYDESIDICKTILSEKRKVTAEVEFAALTLIGDSYWKQQYDDKCSHIMIKTRRVLEKLEPSNKLEFSDWLAIFRKTEGNLLNVEHRYNEAIAKFRESLELYENVEDKLNQGIVLQNISLSYRILGNYDCAKKYVNRALKICRRIGENLEISKCQNILGIIAVDQNDYDSAFIIFKENLKLLEEIDDKNELSRAFCNISLMLLNGGKLVEAKKYAKDALNISELLNDQVKNCRYLNNLGLIFWNQNDYSSALECYQKSLQIIQLEKYDLDQEYILVLGNLGYLYSDLGEYKQSKLYFNKALSFLKSIENYEEISSYMQLPYLLFGLILINIELKEEKNINHHFEELTLLNNMSDDTYLNALTDLANALILKSKEGLADKFKSQVLLETIIQQETIDYKFLLMGIFHLCDLYLIELKISENENVLTKLELLIDKMISIADKQNIPQVKAQAYILKSNISLIHLEVDKAMKYIKKSKDIGLKNELETLLSMIEVEESQIISKISMWESLVENNSKLSQRLKETQVEKFLAVALSSYSPK